MRHRSGWTVVALVGALGTAGCCIPVWPIASLNGVATDSTLILDSTLIGTWLWVRGPGFESEPLSGCASCDTLAFRVDVEPEPATYPERLRYIVRWQHDCEPGDTAVSRAELTRIGRFEYLDLWTEPEPWQLRFIPLHYITRVDRHGDRLIIRSPDPDEAEERRAVLSDAPGIGLLGDDWETLATGTTEQMRLWIEQRFKPHHVATARSTTVPYLDLVLVRAR